MTDRTERIKRYQYLSVLEDSEDFRNYVLNEVEREKKEAEKKLMHATESVELYRAQGALEAHSAFYRIFERAKRDYQSMKESKDGTRKQRRS